MSKDRRSTEEIFKDIKKNNDSKPTQDEINRVVTYMYEIGVVDNVIGILYDIDIKKEEK